MRFLSAFSNSQQTFGPNAIALGLGSRFGDIQLANSGFGGDPNHFSLILRKPAVGGETAHVLGYELSGAIVVRGRPFRQVAADAAICKINTTATRPTNGHCNQLGSGVLRWKSRKCRYRK